MFYVVSESLPATDVINYIIPLRTEEGPKTGRQNLGLPNRLLPKINT